MDSTSGIVHNSGVANGDLVHLPLKEVHVNSSIIDISARVTLTQSFLNPSEHATNKAVYYFPVPASAAVCAFEMRLDDGRIIKGISRDNKSAVEEFERAVREGREASLLKWVTNDIFTISIGSIPAHQTVETKLVFVMNLMNEDTDQIRFYLPMHVGQRYGELPLELVGSSQASPKTRVRITTDIQTSGRILKIDSPSHAGEIISSQYPTHLNRPSRRRATVKFKSKTFLNCDFVLIIEAEKLDSPRCFAELEGDPDRKASLALQLAIVPKFNLVSNRPQEYIFVVDRSGSMANARIETAKRTLEMLLRMLPQNQTFFNIISFGSDTDRLWDDSQVYSQRTLDIATSLVERMDANFGGTEILNAMRNVLSSRRSDIATAIFLLTDGEAYQIDDTTRLVQSATDSASASAPLHVYVLGIGEQVSTAMCEGIARAGNGVCLFAHQAESITSKCARLLRAGRTPFIKNATIDWGLSEEYIASASNSVFFSNNASSQRLTRLRSFPVLQQAPTKIGDIHAGVRFTVYAILRLKRVAVPVEVILRGNLDDTGEPFEWRVPIRGVQLTNEEPGLSAIHTIAAWHFIQEHDMGRAPLPSYLPSPGIIPALEELHEAAMIRLGETYQLASRYTSFVAVESGRAVSRGRQRRSDFGSWTPEPAVSRSRSPSQAASGVNTAGSLRSPLSTLYADLISGLTALFAPTSSSTTMPGEWPEHSPSTTTVHGDNTDEGYQSSDSARTFTTISSVFGWNSGKSDWSDDDSPIAEETQGGPAPQFVPVRFAPPHIQQSSLPIPPRTRSPPPPPPILPEIVDLVKEQQFDGSYNLNDKLRLLVGDAAYSEPVTRGLDNKTWATALSVAYIKTQLGNQRELVDDLVYKSLEYLRIGGNEYLIERATTLITTI
ncbi:von Willebrand factor type A domain-containing protein [Lentinula lateritia]|uniref:von Willebrand factor type A domain-containing protein n=1 Tax=Lentinula lateritia TaxID=40482 RepID=A0ABQ8VSD5_9AGAR|nr:von Willebrand factor type A domain-containing protein [Lentinula lateritia]